MSLRFIYAGTPNFSAQCLEFLLTNDYRPVAVYTQPDRPAGRGKKLRLSPVKELALKHEIPVFSTQQSESK